MYYMRVQEQEKEQEQKQEPTTYKVSWQGKEWKKQAGYGICWWGMGAYLCMAAGLLAISFLGHKHHKKGCPVGTNSWTWSSSNRSRRRRRAFHALE